MRKILENERNESGFTLVEILVVIAIIGILTAIAVPLFLNQKRKAVEAAMVSDVHSIKLAMEECVVKTKGTYPDIYFNWGPTTSVPPCLSHLKLSEGTNTHAFDFGQYYPASGYKPGQVYCIEANNANAQQYLFFRSDKGVATKVACQSQ